MQIERRAFLAGATALAGCAVAPATPAQPANIAVDVIATGLRWPWSIAFVPGGDMLVGEKQGGVRVVRNGRLLPNALPGGPANILARSDSGLLDVVLAPDFATSREVFIAFNEGTEQANQLALFRAKLEGDALTGGRVIWRGREPKAKPAHSGGRIAFMADGTLLLTTADGYEYKEKAQDLSSWMGKTLRFMRDGRPAPGNPFIGREGALPEIWTFGHRNPLGLMVDPRDNSVWLHEMGPRGGDELNRLIAGANYGWPRTSYGTDYDGTMITKDNTSAGVTNPTAVWVPSISPSGLCLYSGDKFPDWTGDFFIGCLTGRRIQRVRIRNNAPVLEERLLADRNQRIRDVRCGPDGFLYALMDHESGEVWRIRPA